MAETQVIKAEGRPARGKSGARAIRREGRVPAVVYGGDVATQETVALDANELWKTISRGRFLASVFDLEVGGKKTKVIPRDVQLDPVRDTPVHVDFQRIGADNRVKLRVPVKFINDLLSPGLKRGGVLNVVRREIEVWAPADKVPEQFEINLEGLDIGRSIHISAVKLPDGVRPVIQGRDFTVATIAGASAKGEADEAAPGAAAAAGEGAAAAAPAAGDAKAAPAAAAKPDAKAKK
ncbi:MAG: 50S ribosomal protein L25/general stress protein Ctc [Proteobacteria bacterium]|nr:50S ribosomal protein L25/general stress protein Ctc [Pseudomonadota bacterium]